MSTLPRLAAGALAAASQIAALAFSIRGFSTLALALALGVGGGCAPQPLAAGGSGVPPMAAGAERGPQAVDAGAIDPVPATEVALPAGAIPRDVRSGEVNDDGTVIYVAPDDHSARRGTVAIGTRVPVLARMRGAGCGDFRFVQIGDEAFVCEQKLVWSTEPPLGVAQPPVLANGLPREYAFVMSDGTPAYSRLEDYDTDEYAIILAQDFGIAIAERGSYQGVPFVRSSHGYWLAQESVRSRAPSTFAGQTLALDADLTTLVFAPRNVVEKKGAKRAPAAPPLRPEFTMPPPGVGPDERWVDVDTARQILMVYQGRHPIFATLVSTGLPTELTETPKGDFRIWAKLATSDMNDTEREDVEHNYSIEAVPWVMYFQESVALHGVFWHDKFGEKRSHGCVNLSPSDARTVFGLLEPALPDGWYAILSTEKHPGSRVIVR